MRRRILRRLVTLLRPLRRRPILRRIDLGAPLRRTTIHGGPIRIVRRQGHIIHRIRGLLKAALLRLLLEVVVALLLTVRPLLVGGRFTEVTLDEELFSRRLVGLKAQNEAAKKASSFFSLRELDKKGGEDGNILCDMRAVPDRS